MNTAGLFQNKSDCCGCGACQNVCTKGAIVMCEDEFGFVYPKIDPELCVECGMCKKVCGYQNQPEKSRARQVYAAASKNSSLLKKSASGGVFAQLAGHFLTRGGVVYGVALPLENGVLTPRHIRVSQLSELKRLQGSKYVQSDTGFVFRQVKQDLSEGKPVLFSGTPCQVATLRQFLSKKYDNLLLAEVICHGVPSKKMFQDFIRDYGKSLDGTVEEFYFRDKSKGQGYVTRCVYQTRSGQREETVKQGELLAYIHFFSKSYICRESCYSCPFAAAERVADITLGDYWGFHEEYPEYRERDGLSNERGVSCVLVNTDQGKRYLNEIRDGLVLLESTFEQVARHNAQLREPSPRSEIRETILTGYRDSGYPAVSAYFARHCGAERMKHRVSGLLPKGFKRWVKKRVGQLKTR